MRTTLTLDDDVAALVRRVREARKASLRDVVNEALRQGLRQMEAPPAARQRHSTRAVSLGQCLIGGIDDVSEALALAEGEAFR